MMVNLLKPDGHVNCLKPKQHDRHFTYHVALSGVRVTIVAVEKQLVLHICVRACRRVRVGVLVRGRVCV
jgi:hypothetical protein